MTNVKSVFPTPERKDPPLILRIGEPAPNPPLKFQEPARTEVVRTNARISVIRYGTIVQNFFTRHLQVH
jgi:hypothetical protein